MQWLNLAQNSIYKPGLLFHGVTFKFSVCEVAVHEASLVTIGTHDASTVDTVTSFVNTYRIPYVTSSSMSDLAHSKYVINLKPDVTKSIVDILTSYHWRQVVYVYESESGK